jgi:carbon storage regulator
MLYLTRKVGESVLINDDIEVTVVEVRGRSIKLGFTFPSGVTVLRRELFEKIRRENLEAAQVDPSLLDADSEAAEAADPPEPVERVANRR